MLGHNFRLGEIECAIGIEQLKKLNRLIKKRIKLVEILNRELIKLKYLKTPKTLKKNSHVYYLYPLTLETDKLNIKRSTIISNLKKLGVPGLIEEYVNIHELPTYKKKIAYGTRHFPWKLNKNDKKNNSDNKNLDIAEKLHREKFFAIELCLFDFNNRDIYFIINCFKKVWDTLNIK